MICKKCKLDKTLDAFYPSLTKLVDAGIRKMIPCKKCHSDHKNRMNKVRRKEHRDKINKVKIERGCIDCGFNRHPAALHFDHRDRNQKRFLIAQSRLYSFDTILSEIAKCDVRCANCHAIKTFDNKEFIHKNGIMAKR